MNNIPRALYPEHYTLKIISKTLYPKHYTWNIIQYQEHYKWNIRGTLYLAHASMILLCVCPRLFTVYLPPGGLYPEHVGIGELCPADSACFGLLGLLRIASSRWGLLPPDPGLLLFLGDLPCDRSSGDPSSLYRLSLEELQVALADRG